MSVKSIQLARRRQRALYLGILRDGASLARKHPQADEALSGLAAANETLTAVLDILEPLAAGQEVAPMKADKPTETSSHPATEAAAARGGGTGGTGKGDKK